MLLKLIFHKTIEQVHLIIWEIKPDALKLPLINRYEQLVGVVRVDETFGQFPSIIKFLHQTKINVDAQRSAQSSLYRIAIHALDVFADVGFAGQRNEVVFFVAHDLNFSNSRFNTSSNH
jgi:hypothetical protein